MLSAVELVGEVIAKHEDSKEISYLIVKIERPFLDSYHEPVYDQIMVFGWKGIVDTPKIYHEIGDYICVKGRLENHHELGTVVVGEYIRSIYRKQR